MFDSNHSIVIMAVRSFVIYVLLISSGYLGVQRNSDSFANASPPVNMTTEESCKIIGQELRAHLNRSAYCLRKTVLRDCCDSLIVRGIGKTGIYRILDDKTRGVCDNEVAGGGGWLKMIRNNNLSNDKFRRRTWRKYEVGFGNFNQNFFLGLQTLHRLTANSTMQLRVDLTNSSGNYWALYEDFAVGDAQSLYKLRIGNFSNGNLRDLFSQHNNGEFRTADRNWPEYPLNYVGGWWWMPINGRINFAPYSVRGIFWHDSSKEIDLYHLFDQVEIRIRSKRYPCFR